MSLTTQQTLALALQHLQMGRVEEAEALYRQILAENPDHPDALGMLGAAAYQAGRPAEAADLLRQAIARNPRSAVYPSNLGMALASQRQFPEAIAAFRRAVSLRPDFPEALNNLGNALNESGKPEEAIGVYEKCISSRPDYAQAYHNLGNALIALGRVNEAIASYRRAIELLSSFPEARLHLGNALYQSGQTQEAMAAYQELLESWPDYPEAHNAVGHLLKESGKTDEAIARFRAALSLKPEFPEALHNLGVVLHDIGRVDEAIAVQRRAIAARGDFADAHFALSWGLLLEGNFREGWEEHEWRKRRQEWLRSNRDFPQPLWDGSELQGRRILLHCEQGFGDTIQFIRYVPLVARRGGDITVLCPAPLRRLLSGQLGITNLLTHDDPLPDFDVHCPLMTLPKLFDTTLATVPADVPYLRADRKRMDEFSDRIRQADKETRRQGACTDLVSPSPPLPLSASPLKVGLAWAGSGSFVRDRNRSIHFDQLAPLAQVPNVRFYSLQKGPPAQEAKSGSFGNRTWASSVEPQSAIGNLVDWTAELTDFADTAALIAALDLVISIDTSVAHLAGALAKPVWVLLPFAPDWRWLLGRPDSPWYATMRLFRQLRLGDWDGPVRQIAQELRER